MLLHSGMKKGMVAPGSDIDLKNDGQLLPVVCNLGRGSIGCCKWYDQWKCLSSVINSHTHILVNAMPPAFNHLLSDVETIRAIPACQINC